MTPMEKAGRYMDHILEHIDHGRICREALPEDPDGDEFSLRPFGICSACDAQRAWRHVVGYSIEQPKRKIK